MKHFTILALFSGALVWTGTPGFSRRAAPPPIFDVEVSQDFQWTGRLEMGQTLELKGINGDIRAELADGDEVVVVAHKFGRRDHEESVEIEVVEHDGGVTICAVYPSRRYGRRHGRESVCAPGREGRLSSHDNDVQVNFEARIPAGINFVGKTVNGSVDAVSLDGDVFGYTVNGDVDIAATGVAEAQTVNGSIDVRMGRADWSGELEFQTVNGSITLRFPDTLTAELRGETLNGSIESDFPITIMGRFGPRRLSGVIGDGGGRLLNVETVNGSIRLLSSR